MTHGNAYLLNTIFLKKLIAKDSIQYQQIKFANFVNRG